MSREAVVVGGVRTPFGRRDGMLNGWHPVDLLAETLAELVSRSNVDPSEVDDVICGCVAQVGEQAYNVGRNAWLAAGLPEGVPATTVDRQCGSSLQAVHFAAQGIIAGAYDLAIACGVESMTRIPMGSSTKVQGHPHSDRLRTRYDDGLVHQGISAELIAERWDISREEADMFSARSHELAGEATTEGRFEEIYPVKVSRGNGTELLNQDEGIRRPNLQKMASLPPAFKESGRVTAANSSQVADGASGILIAERQKAIELGLPMRATFRAFAVVGDDPVYMLTAPIPATDRVMRRSGLKLAAMDAVEVNEAFASVVLAWKKELEIPDDWFNERVNVNGGAIALGHPLGASGARLLINLVNVLHQRGGRFGLVTMCEGGGQANATVIERIG